MEVLNKQEDIDMKLTSRYTIVIAAAKRARQLIEGDEALCDTESGKAVSVAISEMYEGKLAISLSKDVHGNDVHPYSRSDGSDFFPEYSGDME